MINEVQEVQCDTTGGEFVVGVLDDFVFICHDANEKEIKDTIESQNQKLICGGIKRVLFLRYLFPTKLVVSGDECILND